MDPSRSLQDQFAPNNRCFGCGPANERGLRIKSFVRGDEVVARFAPEEYHQAFEGMLNGGIIGALLDCHSNWTAAYTLMHRDGSDVPPCTVTAEFCVTLSAPTPLAEVRLVARPAEMGTRRVVVDAELWSGDVPTAKCRGIFVAVKEGHPAYHRW